MERVPYGTLPDGGQVEQFTMKNANGLEVRCINYGCRITHIILPDGADVVLGFDDLAGYLSDTGSGQGAFIGRYAGRIENAEFDIDGEHYEVTKNSDPDFLHGVFAYTLFTAEVNGENSVAFTYDSPDGEDGFPGNLSVRVAYSLNDKNEVTLDYKAETDKATHLNFTNHAYFNLGGYAHGTLDDQMLTLPSALFLEAGPRLLATGRMLETAGGVFDFTSEKAIGRDIDSSDPQIVAGGGYDHCFVVEREEPGLALAAIARDAGSGRTLRVYTTEPDVHLYTANFLDGAMVGKGGVPLNRRSAFCLETQHFPCTPSRPNFPTTLVRPGERFHETSVWQFGW